MNVRYCTSRGSSSPCTSASWAQPAGFLSHVKGLPASACTSTNVTDETMKAVTSTKTKRLAP